MTTRFDRRTFLASAAALSATFACRASGDSPATRDDAKRSQDGPRKLSILVLGGTRFVGPPLVECALERGHSVTLFNRGKTNADLFPSVEKLRGDRDGDSSALRGRTWDVVYDTWTDRPRHVRTAAELLAGSIGTYVFVSSLNALADISQRGVDETAPRIEPSAPDEEGTDVAGFGPRKARCELLLESILPDRNVIVRPGLIVGTRDNSDRFTYWPARIERGGEVLAPGKPDDPVQFVDVRDLGRFLVELGEDRARGVFHVVGPATPLGIGALLDTCKRVTQSDATFTWVPAQFLLEHQVTPWRDMPCWIPSLAENEAYWTLDVRKAIAAGLTFRPLEDTIADSLAWWHALPEDRRAHPKNGIPPDREREVLAAWHAR